MNDDKDMGFSWMMTIAFTLGAVMLVLLLAGLGAVFIGVL